MYILETCFQFSSCEDLQQNVALHPPLSAGGLFSWALTTLEQELYSHVELRALRSGEKVLWKA